MATSRPSPTLLDDHRSIAWYGHLAIWVGSVLACIALAVAAVSGAVLANGSATLHTVVTQMVHVAGTDPASLSLVETVYHYALLGVALGTWFVGLGFLVTGYFE